MDQKNIRRRKSPMRPVPANIFKEKSTPEKHKPDIHTAEVPPSFFKRATRIFYWGTLMAQFIIASVSLTFLYCNSYFYPVMNIRQAIDFGAFLHLFVFCVNSVLTQYNFLMAIFVGPGYVPRKWQPEDKKAFDLLQYCKVCEGYKAPRAHHCRKCGRCVSKMEHHCPWINNCVGHRNHAYFLRFLFFAVLGCIQAFAIMMIMVVRIFTYFSADFQYNPRRRYVTWYSKLLRFLYFQPPPVFFDLPGLLWLVLMIGFSFGVILAVGVLFVIQLRIILKNETSIESWIIGKANYYLQEEAEENEKKEVKKFRNPYNLGWKHNLHQVILNRSQNPVGNGIWWPVHEEDNQFTLTAEQLRQKQLKNSASVPFYIKEKYNGKMFPVFSQGFLVGLTAPWTFDEPRLLLHPGDRVKVTRFQKRWLYGEKFASDQQNGNVETEEDEKGWFPRRIAIKIASSPSSN